MEGRDKRLRPKKIAAEETIIASVEGMGLPAISATTTGDDGRPDRDPVTVEITWDMGAAGADDEGGENEGGADG
ncbi:MAG: hypothetical protein DI550_23895, partial [Escherichia coli]